MIARRAARLVALAVAACLWAGAAYAQGMALFVEIGGANPRPVKPGTPVNTLQEMMTAFRGCWNPPPLDRGRQPLDLSFQVSFKRSGELFGKPRAVIFARQVTDEERQDYYTAVAEAVDRCSQMPFTESMGGAVAGRTFKVNFIDRRNSRKTEITWPTEKS